MQLKVYIAYGTPSDQVTALRLQALGAVNGLAVYVPPVFTRQDATSSLDSNSEQQFRECDAVLGVVTSGISETCRRELNLGKQLDKRVIIVGTATYASSLEPFFPGSVVFLNPDNPTDAERQIVSFLRESGLRQDAAKALLALGTITLGLMLFAPND